MVNPNIIRIINNYINELFQNGLILSKVILYGSRARNLSRKDSDIDLMLISSYFDDELDKYTPIIWLCAADIDYRIEPYPVGEKRFNEDNISPIIQVAKKEGIEIELNFLDSHD